MTGKASGFARGELSIAGLPSRLFSVRVRYGAFAAFVLKAFVSRSGASPFRHRLESVAVRLS